LHHTIFYATAGATLSQSTVIAPACLQYKSFDYFKAEVSATIFRQASSNMYPQFLKFSGIEYTSF
jgi:hypothetical protein